MRVGLGQSGRGDQVEIADQPVAAKSVEVAQLHAATAVLAVIASGAREASFSIVRPARWQL